MANNEYVNKVNFGDETLIDLTNDTVTEDTLVTGYTAHTRSGATITGTLGDATTSTHGLMSASDKSKLDGIANNANNYVLPTASSTEKGGIVVDSTLSPFTIWTNPLNNRPILTMNFANSATIKNGSSATQPVAVLRQHESIFYGLAKAAGDTSQASSDNSVGIYTTTAAIAIRSMLGVTEIPSVTAADNGKILRVVDGAWAVVSLPSASGVSF